MNRKGFINLATILAGAALVAVAGLYFKTRPELNLGASAFPSSLSSFTSGSRITSDWGNALEAKIGTNSSAVTSSLDYITKSTSSPLGQVRSLTATTGNLIVGSSSAWTALTVGSNGKVLTASSTAQGGVSWQTPASGAGTATFYVPQHLNGQTFGGSFTFASSTVSTTVAHYGAIEISKNITVNKLTFMPCDVGSAATTTIDIALYSADGQTKYFDVTSSAFSSDTDDTTSTVAVSSVALSPGIYYLAIVPNINPSGENEGCLVFSENSREEIAFVASEPLLAGTRTVAAGTLPSTFDPTALTYPTNIGGVNYTTLGTLYIRLDN
jgi:hypothetical protein